MVVVRKNQTISQDDFTNDDKLRRGFSASASSQEKNTSILRLSHDVENLNFLNHYLNILMAAFQPPLKF